MQIPNEKANQPTGRQHFDQLLVNQLLKIFVQQLRQTKKLESMLSPRPEKL